MPAQSKECGMVLWTMVRAGTTAGWRAGEINLKRRKSGEVAAFSGAKRRQMSPSVGFRRFFMGVGGVAKEDGGWRMEGGQKRRGLT
jgi:hypothetical protein